MRKTHTALGCAYVRGYTICAAYSVSTRQKQQQSCQFTHHAVAPVYVDPPHCPYSAMLPDELEVVVADLDEDVLVLVVLVDALVVTELATMEVTVPPEDPYSGGPGME